MKTFEGVKKYYKTKVTNADQPQIKLMGSKGLMVHRDDANPLGFIKLLSDKGFAESKLFSYLDKAKKGYYIEWLYVEKPLKAKGASTRKEKISGPESFQVKGSMDLNLVTSNCRNKGPSCQPARVFKEEISQRF